MGKLGLWASQGVTGEGRWAKGSSLVKIPILVPNANLLWEK